MKLLYECYNCFQNPESIFYTLTEEQKKKLMQNISCINYKNNEIIFKEGFKPTGLIVLAKGKAKIYKEGIGGREQILRLIRPGHFIGFRALFAGEYYNASASAIEDSTICVIDKVIFLNMVKENNDLAFAIIKLFAEELGEAENRIISLTQKHLRGRLAEALIILSKTYGYEADGKTLNIRLSRESLANLSNMTTSNAIKTLYEFKDEGVIELDGKKIKIINKPKLESIMTMG